MTVQTIVRKRSDRLLPEDCADEREPGRTTRTFLSPPMRDAHQLLREWMERIGMVMWVDAVGNLRGRHEELKPDAPRLLIGSPRYRPKCRRVRRDSGRGDGHRAGGESSRAAASFAIEIAFSEEGVRFGVAFIGSRALVGTAEALLERKDAAGTTVARAIRHFGIDPQVEGLACGGKCWAISNSTSSRVRCWKA